LRSLFKVDNSSTRFGFDGVEALRVEIGVGIRFGRHLFILFVDIRIRSTRGHLPEVEAVWEGVAVVTGVAIA
jgi:hypothetical protein